MNQVVFCKSLSIKLYLVYSITLNWSRIMGKYKMQEEVNLYISRLIRLLKEQALPISIHVLI